MSTYEDLKHDAQLEAAHEEWLLTPAGIESKLTGLDVIDAIADGYGDPAALGEALLRNRRGRLGARAIEDKADPNRRVAIAKLQCDDHPQRKRWNSHLVDLHSGMSEIERQVDALVDAYVDSLRDDG